MFCNKNCHLIRRSIDRKMVDECLVDYVELFNKGK